MSWKIVFVGGVVYYAVFFLLSMIGGYFIHSPEGVLGEVYRQYASFWRPELNADPPDMASLMKLWVPVGILSSLLFAGIFSVIRGSFAGPGIVRGLKFGVISWIFGAVAAMGYWGVFSLPGKIWAWWTIEGVWLHLVSGAVLGWVSQKLAPAEA